MPDRLEELRLRLRLVQTTRLPLDVRFEEFHEALADILEMRSGFDPDARRVHLARRILHVASAHYLTFDDDEGIRDALQA
jgi:hypothetical protein